MRVLRRGSNIFAFGETVWFSIILEEDAPDLSPAPVEIGVKGEVLVVMQGGKELPVKEFNRIEVTSRKQRRNKYDHLPPALGLLYVVRDELDEEARKNGIQ